MLKYAQHFKLPSIMKKVGGFHQGLKNLNNSILAAKFRKITYLHLRMHAGAGLSQLLIIMYYTVFVKFSETRKLVVGSRKQEMGHKLIIAKQQ